MRKNAASLILGIALASPIYVSSAEQPLILSGAQMDQVTAGDGLIRFEDVIMEGGIFDQLRNGTYIQNFFGQAGSTNPFGAFSQTITELRERTFSRTLDVRF